MKKMGIAGLALLIVGALMFGVGFIGARGDLSVVNGNMGPFRVQLADGHIHNGFFYTDNSSKTDSSKSGIGGGRNKPVTTPPVTTPPSDRVVISDNQESTSLAAEGIKKIQIRESLADVELLPSDDGEIHVYAEKRSDFYCEIENKNGTLKIERRSSVKWGINIGSLERSVLRVAVPEGLYCSLDIENSCGDVSVSGLTLADVEIDADMGGVSFENIQCTGVKLETDCGSVYAEDLTCTGDVKVKSALGEVTLRNISAVGQLKAESDCGAVTVDNCRAAKAELQADMGDIRAYELDVSDSVKLDCDCGAIELRALSAGKSIELDNSLGSIEGTLAGSFDDYSIESGADLGSNNLPSELRRGGVELKVFTSCGSIDIGFEEN